MSKETAVEYMFRLLDVMTFDKDSESADIWEAIYHRALEMEREQMGEAFDESRLTNQWVVLTESAFQHKSFQDYYNETYKGGEK
jgi:hypothetical protein